MTLITDADIQEGLNRPKSHSLNPKQQAAYIQENVLKEWKPERETFFLRHGTKMLAMMGLLPSYLLVQNEAKLKFVDGKRTNVVRVKPVRGVGKAYVIFATTVMSGMLTYTFHSLFVTPDILVRQSCDACIQTRSMGNQVLSGVLTPMLTSIAGVHFVAAHNGYERQISSAREMFKYIINAFQRNKRALAIGAPISVAASFLVTYMSQDEWKHILREIKKFEEMHNDK